MAYAAMVPTPPEPTTRTLYLGTLSYGKEPILDNDLVKVDDEEILE